MDNYRSARRPAGSGRDCFWIWIGGNRHGRSKRQPDPPRGRAGRAAERAPRPPQRPGKEAGGQGRKKLVKRLIALGVAAAILGGGGFALYRFLTDTDRTSVG